MRPYVVRHLTRRTYLLGRHLFSSSRSLHLSCIPAPAPASYLRYRLPFPLRISGARSFWGIGESDKTRPSSSAEAQKIKDREDRGIATMTKLLRYLDEKIGRPPADAQLLRVLRHAIRATDGIPLPAGYVMALSRTYLYLKRAVGLNDIPVKVIRELLWTVEVDGGKTKDQYNLATILWEDLKARPEHEFDQNDYMIYITCLSNNGHTARALQILMGVYGSWHRGVKSGFEKILRGFRKEGNEEALLGTWEFMKKANIGFTARHYQHVTVFYLHKGDLETAKTWYRHAFEAGIISTITTYTELLKACVKSKDFVFGNNLISTLSGVETTPSAVFHPNKEHLNLALAFSLPMGKTPEEVDALLESILCRAKESPTAPRLDMDTFNTLIRYGVKQKDISIFEHYLKMSEQWDLEPDLETLGLKLQAYIFTNDPLKAQLIYESFRLQEIPPNFSFDAIRSYIRFICAQPTWDTKQIRAIYSDILDWNVRLDISTFCPLLRVLLEETLFGQVMELCEREAETYCLEDRKLIIAEMGEYIGRSTTSIEAAWDAYTILYQVCPELTVHERTDIMRLFFDLGRSDMAYHVLQHMRKNPQRQPTKQTYTAAFTGIAYSRDIEALRLVHNQLKLDMDIDPDTHLMNALMNAYNYCGVYGRVLTFWDEVRRSREGPDYRTISIVLDACGRMATGLRNLKKIWGELKGMGVKPHTSNFCSYVEALGRHERWEEAWTVVREMEVERGVRPDDRVLGTLHNTVIPELKEKVKEWAREAYPQEWSQAEDILGKMEKERMVAYSIHDELSTYT